MDVPVTYTCADCLYLSDIEDLGARWCKLTGEWKYNFSPICTRFECSYNMYYPLKV